MTGSESQPDNDESQLTDNPLALNDAQRRALSVRLTSIDEHFKLLRQLSIEDPLLTDLERDLADLARRAAAPIEVPKAPDPAGVLFYVLITLDEIAPKAIMAYGSLDTSAQEYLGPAVDHLYEVAEELRKRLRVHNNS